jgi:hypothetical protein
MKKVFIKSGEKYLALNLKSATSSLIRAISKAHYPDLEDTLENNSSYPTGVTSEGIRLHAFLDKTETPEGIVVLVVRDPIERFRSACAETGKTAEEALSEQGQKNSHFWPTTRLLIDGIKLYRFESDLDEVATELGLPLPLPNISSNGQKPDLTPEQIARVQAIYSDDIALHESITEAGQVWTAPPVPATDEAKDLKRQELATARHEAVNGGTTFNGIPIRTDNQTRNELSTARQFAKDDPNLTIQWKLGNGSFITLDSPTIIAMADAVLAHQQAQFTKEKLLNDQIDAVTTAEELKAVEWS